MDEAISRIAEYTNAMQIRDELTALETWLTEQRDTAKNDPAYEPVVFRVYEEVIEQVAILKGERQTRGLVGITGMKFDCIEQFTAAMQECGWNISAREWKKDDAQILYQVDAIGKNADKNWMLLRAILGSWLEVLIVKDL
jgi:hypothetical protein